MGYRCFNPRPLASGRPGAQRLTGTRYLVSIHARSRAGDYLPLAQLHLNPKFQSTPARERATFILPRPNPFLRFQSTPARERATVASAEFDKDYLVSIHARSRAGDLQLITSYILR